MTPDAFALFIVIAFTICYATPAFVAGAALVLGWLLYVRQAKQQADTRRLAGTISALALLLQEVPDE